MALTNQQYEEIMRSYGAQQRDNRLELMRRRSEIAKKIPAYITLEQDAATLSVAHGKQRLAGTVTDNQSLKAGLEEIARQKLTLLQEGGYPSDYLTAPCSCPDCRDTGFIAGEKCHCFRRKEAELLFAASGWTSLADAPGFEGVNESYYTGEDLSRFRTVLARAKEFVSSFPAEQANLLFYGQVGVGKSFLSACIAKELINSGYTVLYFSAISLFQMMGDIAYGRSDAAALQHIYDCDLLILDDLGSELPTRFTISHLFQCLNERHLRARSTIVSTNLSYEEIKERYTDRILSRLIEQFEFFRFQGPDIRLLKKTGEG